MFLSPMLNLAKLAQIEGLAVAFGGGPTLATAFTCAELHWKVRRRRGEMARETGHT
jgi:hypothetical protein